MLQHGHKREKKENDALASRAHITAHCGEYNITPRPTIIIIILVEIF
jgi:hypothetical protein